MGKENIQWADTSKVIEVEGTGAYLLGRVQGVWVTTLNQTHAMTVSALLADPQLLKDFVGSGLNYDTVDVTSKGNEKESQTNREAGYDHVNEMSVFV